MTPLLCAVLLIGAEPTEAFTEKKLEPAFSAYLETNPLLMETAGAKVIRISPNKTLILAVASTVLKDESPAERLRAERVCRVKALASVVAEKEGVQVAHTEKVEDRTVIVIDNEKEKATSVSEVLSVTKTHVQGITKEMPVVGRWKSADGKVFYLAVGSFCDKKGEAISPQ